MTTITSTPARGAYIPDDDDNNTKRVTDGWTVYYRADGSFLPTLTSSDTTETRVVGSEYRAVREPQPEHPPTFIPLQHLHLRMRLSSRCYRFIGNPIVRISLAIPQLTTCNLNEHTIGIDMLENILDSLNVVIAVSNAHNRHHTLFLDSPHPLCDTGQSQYHTPPFTL
ncbi:hypothetical protein BJ165DRAFT_1526534 [Panaeolus papilionaceus]|nr:hypothetical protein BJ165DRAFT_1526534 [Panaeolus papilionaceus]